MASIGESLRKVGYLQPLMDRVSAELQRTEREKGIANYIQMLKDSQGQINALYNPTELQPNIQNNLQPSGLGTKLNSAVQKKYGNVSVPDMPVLPKFDIKEKPVDYEDANRKALELQNNLAISGLENQVSPELINTGMTFAERLKNAYQQQKPEDVTLPEGSIRVRLDKNGKEISRIENVKDFRKEGDKKLTDFTGTDNQPYVAFQRPDGTTYAINTVTGKPAPEGMQVRQSASGETPAWANYALSLQKFIQDSQEKTQNKQQKESTSQEKYNNIMGAPYKSLDEIKAMGINTDGIDAGKFGGAYVVQLDNGQSKLVTDGSVLQNFAQQQVPDAPNKWKRNKKKQDNGKKKQDNDPLGIR